MTLFNFRHASIKQKIGGLFLFLLFFLFSTIMYSSYKLKVLEEDMKEVAYIDIPLNQIVAQIEFIELEQHLSLKEFERQKSNTAKDLKPHQQLVLQKRQVKTMLDKAINLLKSSIAHHQLVLDAEEHQQVLTQLASYQTTSDNFEQQLNDIYSREAVNENELNQIESMATKLEQEEKTLLTLLTELSKNDSYFTEKHEEDFFVINAILGSCALTLGLLLTVYIVQIIVKRIQNIQQQITIFDVSLNNDDKSSDAKLTINTKDELEELEFDIQLLMSKLSKEIATREQVEKQLLQLVSQDKLTGLYNRHKWDEQIHMHINLAQRGYPFGLIVLDVDYFKKINDQHGHWVGDKLLQSLAQEISKNVRDIDLTFRLGGEEFAVICPMNDTTHLGKVAEELRHAIEKMRIDDLPALTVSIGIAASNVSDTSASIFKRADIALYRAKSQGRNQIINGDIAEDE